MSLGSAPLLYIPFALLGALMLFDEGYFHVRRGLPRWERIGHPVDTAVFMAAIAWAAVCPAGGWSLGIFVALGLFSCVVITKDEWVHAECCSGGEQFVHALLFVLHPLALLAAWKLREAGLPLWPLLAASGALGAWQVIYWNVVRDAATVTAITESAVNNELYDTLGDRWYHADDDPVALLRAESRLRNPWLAAKLRERFADRAPSDIAVLDVGCGAGFLSNALASDGFRVVGLDLSVESLEVARRFDATRSVRHVRGDAAGLPFASASFDAICMMDVLEHVEDPAAVIAEAARALRPGGVIFFHTFNRTPAAWLFAAKGLELVVRNTPKNLHVSRLFIKPRELRATCEREGLRVGEMVGVKPILLSRAFLQLLLTGIVPRDFRFEFSSSLAVGYSGWAHKPRVVA